MKQVGSFLRFATVALATSVCLAVARAEVGSAVVTGLKGTADYSQGEGWKSVTRGAVLKPGAVIRTAAESQVDLWLDHNGPRVRVTENTELAIDRLNFDLSGADVVIETQLDLRAGRVQGVVKKTSEASRYEVKTPQGVAAIKGTEYDITAMGVVKVIDGRVVFAYVNAAGQTVTQNISTGEMFMPTENRPRPIEQTELDDLLRQFREIKVVPVGEGLLVIVPPQEPWVSAVVGSAGQPGRIGTGE